MYFHLFFFSFSVFFPSLLLSSFAWFLCLYRRESLTWPFPPPTGQILSRVRGARAARSVYVVLDGCWRQFVMRRRQLRQRRVNSDGKSIREGARSSRLGGRGDIRHGHHALDFGRSQTGWKFLQRQVRHVQPFALFIFHIVFPSYFPSFQGEIQLEPHKLAARLDWRGVSSFHYVGGGWLHHLRPV